MTQLTPQQKRLCDKHAGLAKAIARQILRNNAFLNKADVMSDAMMGLIKAAVRYDPDKGKFSSYAAYKIKGEIYDSVRDQDTLSHNYRRVSNQIEQARYKFAAREHRFPNDQELAQEAKFTIKQLQRHQCVINASHLLYFEHSLQHLDEVDYYATELTLANMMADPEDSFKEIDNGEDWRVLDQLLDKLPGKERFILAMYYWEKMTLEEIGKIMGVTESRISQCKLSALKKLRAWAPAELQELLT